MKKLFLSLLILIASACGGSPAHAGSSSCTATSSVSWAQANPYYTFQSSDCIVSATQSDQGYTSLLAYLPSSPSNGDEFTLKDTTGYATDNCGSYYDDPEWGGDGNTYAYCTPAGYGFQAAGSALVGNEEWGYAQSVTDGEFYYTACNNPQNQACSPEELPSWWADYQRKRYQMKVVYNSGTGNWDLTRSAVQ